MGPAQPVNLVSLRMFHSVMGPWDKSLLLMKDRRPHRATAPAGWAPSPDCLTASPRSFLPGCMGLKAPPSALGTQLSESARGCSVPLKSHHDIEVTPNLTVSPRL